LPDFKVKIRDHIVHILPHSELSRIFNADIALERAQDIVAENFHIDVETMKDGQGFAVVRFPPHKDGYFELVFTYNETVDRDWQIQGYLTNNLSLKANFQYIVGASLYIYFLTNEKYELQTLQSRKKAEKFSNQTLIICPYCPTRDTMLMDLTEVQIWCQVLGNQNILEMLKRFQNCINNSFS
jgi:hypothetical protein